MREMWYNSVESNHINSRGATVIAHGLSNSIGGAITMPDHTRAPQQTQEIPYGYCQCGCGQLAPIAKRNSYTIGHIEGQPVRFIQGHNNYVRSTRPLKERFWEKVNKRGPDECWEWNASRSPGGYGYFHLGSKKDGTGKCDLSHRVAFRLSHGPVPSGKEVCHKCDNPPCCNPNHLYAGTRKDNVHDMLARGRHKPVIAMGESNPAAKLTRSDVDEILLRHGQGESQTVLALEKGISKSQMSRIVRGINWTRKP